MEGYLTLDATRANLTAAVGELLPSKVAVLVKQVGRVRVRLIHDLGRSLVNTKITIAERLVLPRISDAIAYILDMFQAAPTDSTFELMALDFSDAFKQLNVALEVVPGRYFRIGDMNGKPVYRQEAVDPT